MGGSQAGKAELTLRVRMLPWIRYGGRGKHLSYGTPELRSTCVGFCRSRGTPELRSHVGAAKGTQGKVHSLVGFEILYDMANYFLIEYLFTQGLLAEDGMVARFT